MAASLRPAAALLDLSGLCDPAEACHPTAREAIIRTTKALRKHLHAPRWPQPNQVVATAYCALAGDRALLCDLPGVGKTQPALLRILLGRHLPAVVVCPANVLLNWKDEASYWLPGVEAYRLDRVYREVPPRGWPGIVLTTWDLLRWHSGALAALRPRIVIADECHYALGGDKTLRGRHFMVLIAASRHLLMLSGTPLVNRPKDLWRLLHLLDPAAWPSSTIPAFKELGRDDFDTGVQTRLTRRVRTYMIRRQKADALKDLKAKRYRVLRVDLSEVSLAEYHRAEREFAIWLRELATSEAAEAGLSGEELDAAVEDRLASALSSQAIVQVGHLRRIVGRLKAPIAAAWIVEAVRAREPVVAFAEHQEVLATICDHLSRRGIAHGVIDGATAKTRRHSRVKEFQQGKIDALVCSSAAKEGITLTRARHVLFAERWWTSAAEDQGADRLHRIGQTRDVSVWILCARGTVDERMDAVVAKKRKITARTVDAGAAGVAPVV